MGGFFYRYRKIEEPSEYIRKETLRYILNYVRNHYDTCPDSFLDNMLCFLERSEVEKIIGRVATAAKIIPHSSLRPSSNFKYLYKEVVSFLTGFSAFPAISEILEDVIDKAEKELRKLSARKKPTDDVFLSRLLEIREIFKLSDEDLEVFKVLYFSKHNHDFENMCSIASVRINGRMDARSAIVNLRLFTGFPEMTVKKVLGKDAPLRKYGLLEDDFDIVNQISEFLTGLNADPLANKFFRKYSGQPVELEAHISIRQHVEMIEAIIGNCNNKDRVNILLYGQPGTGKTEFCRSMGRHLGRDIYEINTFENDERPYSGTKFRFTALRACQNAIDHGKSIIIVDEADEMLNGGSTASSLFFGQARNTEKDIVNDYLDNNPGVYFWITNHSKSIEESTRRRFDYSIEFRRFSTAQRISLWQSSIKKHQLEGQFSVEDIAEFAKKYEINAGGIDVALKNFKRMSTGRNHAEKQKTRSDIIDKILKTHINLMTGSRKKRELTEPVPFYSLEGLNIKGEIPISESLDILKHFSGQLDDAGGGSKGGRINNMNLLMYGPSGTGKTEFAKYAALEIGRTLICKRGSELLSMWVGGTEQNIREAFREAEDEGAILFIDEADGLFAERTCAQRSWEVTQVNELLSNMEEFKGILICATNFKKNMDAASLRRFNLKIEFDYLDSYGKKLFFERVLGELSGKRLEEKDAAALETIDNLAPGDFKVVRQKYSFMPKEKIGNDILIESLKQEVSCKNNFRASKIGF